MLRIALDDQYPGIVEQARAAVDSVLPPGSRTRIYPSPHANAVVVQASCQHWTDVFPQHGPGPKHARRSAFGAGSSSSSGNSRERSSAA